MKTWKIFISEWKSDIFSFRVYWKFIHSYYWRAGIFHRCVQTWNVFIFFYRTFFSLLGSILSKGRVFRSWKKFILRFCVSKKVFFFSKYVSLCVCVPKCRAIIFSWLFAKRLLRLWGFGSLLRSYSAHSVMVWFTVFSLWQWLQVSGGFVAHIYFPIKLLEKTADI